mgnify:CR=1 FL=1
MSDEKQQAEQAQGQFGIQKIYVKDISFEAPNSPQSFTEEWNPKSNLELNTNAQGIAEHTFEVVLSITLTVKNNDKTAYLVEVQQAGIFTIQGFGDSELRGMLGSFCPNILFPYAREAISDIVTRGGFPQMLLTPINFDALYQQHLQQQAAQTGAQDSVQ